MTRQYMPKIFQDPHKKPRAPHPIYLMYGPYNRVPKLTSLKLS